MWLVMKREANEAALGPFPEQPLFPQLSPFCSTPVQHPRFPQSRTLSKETPYEAMVPRRADLVR